MSAQNPESGTITYTYDLAGNVKTQKRGGWTDEGNSGISARCVEPIDGGVGVCWIGELQSGVSRFGERVVPTVRLR